MRCRTWLILGILLAQSMVGISHAATQARATSIEGNFVVFAPDPASADFAVLEAERVWARFNQLFGSSPSRKSSPIVFVIGASDENRGESGVVKVFPRRSSPKIQANWGETPILLDAFQRGWIRALCVRKTLDAMDEAQRQKTELRVPIWVTEGVAALIAEPDLVEKTFSRATLLARAEPDLSFDEMASELENNTQVNLNTRSLAAVLCRALIQTRSGRDRFFRELNWSEKRGPAQWVTAVGEVNNPEDWWRDVWKSQKAQASWLCLGYNQTLRRVLTLDHASDEVLPTLQKDIASVAHPWFRQLFERKFSRSEGENKMSNLIAELQQAVHQRRASALTWFCEKERAQPPPSRDEWLGWRLLQLDHGARLPARGPAEKWFESLLHQNKKG